MTEDNTQALTGAASELNAELGWPLNINKEMDNHAFISGLAHWSCTSKKSNIHWVRRDGFVHAITFADGDYPTELRKIDIKHKIQEFVF